MKNRDEFIKSVWEKSEKAMAEERARKRRRRQAGGLAAAAACLALVIGITSGGGPAEVFGDLLGAASSDGASVNEAVVLFDTESQEAYDVRDEATSSDDGSDMQVSPSCAGDMEVSLDGAPTSALKLSDMDLYEVLRGETEAAENSGDSDFMGYFCLPIGVQVEDDNGSLVVSADSEELVLQYMKWFYSIPEEQVLTAEEFESLNEIPTGFYKFTMDFSLGADTEGVDRVFWLVDEVTLP